MQTQEIRIFENFYKFREGVIELSSSKKLEGIKVLRGLITNITGLRIGGTEGIVKIGGIDNPIIRNPMNDEPYIPGSSLKGKMRSLLELEKGKIKDNGKPHNCEEKDCMICKLFGVPANVKSDVGPGRLIFRDCFLTEASRKKFEELREREGWYFSEAKTENSINRWTSKSQGLRTMERIPAGAEFEFELGIRVFEGDDFEEIKKWVKDGLKLIQKDALGGCGSRGYGKVRFDKLELDGEEFKLD